MQHEHPVKISQTRTRVPGGKGVSGHGRAPHEFEDDDGCPEADNDGDEIPDAADRCPNDAEDMDGFRDKDGCPEPDNDGDDILDADDKCPQEAEDKDKFSRSATFGFGTSWTGTGTGQCL